MNQLQYWPLAGPSLLLLVAAFVLLLVLLQLGILRYAYLQLGVSASVPNSKFASLSSVLRANFEFDQDTSNL